MTSPVVEWRKSKKGFAFLDKKGKIVSFTRVVNPPQGFGKEAFWVGVIEFPGGKKQTGQLILNGKRAAVGSRVKGVLRRSKETGKEEVVSYTVKFSL
jgi:uncharacterized OB-fold protein